MLYTPRPQKPISPSTKKYTNARREIARILHIARFVSVWSVIPRRLLLVHREFHLNYPNNFQENRNDTHS